MHMSNTTTECQFCRVEHRATVPTVHLNGTPAEHLRDDLQAAIEALRTGAQAMAAAAPNGRDYYVQDAGAIQRVMNQHARRCTDLDRILTELTEMRDHVQAVLDFKAEMRRPR